MRQALMIVVLLLTVAAVPLSADERPNIVICLLYTSPSPRDS